MFPLARVPFLDCYWVASLDFNFLGFPLNPQKTYSLFLQRGQQHPRF